MPTVLNVSNMHCEACARRVTNAIQQAGPGTRAKVDLTAGTVLLEDAGDPAIIMAALDKAGYPATLQR